MTSTTANARLKVAANNQAMQQMQQQQRLQQLQQQQHARQLMQQAYTQGGMAGMPMGVGINMNLLSPAAQQAAQLAAMRARQQNPQAHVSICPGLSNAV